MNRSTILGRRRAPSYKRPARTRLQVERLESRAMLSANIDVSNLLQVQEEIAIDINPLNPPFGPG